MLTCTEKIELLPFVPVEYDKGNLLDAMLLCGNHAIRRVPVVQTPSGDITNIITQSALIQSINDNMPRYMPVASLTLTQLGLGSPAAVISVSTEDTLRTAFRVIRKYDISAVPVINAVTGKIHGNISARDVRLLVMSNRITALLNLTAGAYLSTVTGVTVSSALTCTPDDTLEEVIKRLVQSRIHRIYVVDSQQHVIRVVSLRNILRKFVKEPQNYFGHFFFSF